MMAERLQKLMAQANIGSRRECETIIKKGRVRVNGRVAKLGDKAEPGVDTVEVDGRPLGLEKQELIYIALNKPKGIISSLEDELQQGRKTVRDMIPLPGHLYPVGRLDKPSAGLMLMTNDGDIAHKLTHPRYGHDKQYHVVVEGALSDETARKWARGGMPLDGRFTIPAEVEVVRRQKQFTQLKITMREGRKRQIRRLANMFGHPARELIRERIGPIHLGNLKTGQWRHLSPEEVAKLRKSVADKKPVKKQRKRPSSRSYTGKSGGRKKQASTQQRSERPSRKGDTDRSSHKRQKPSKKRRSNR
ncbi:MAG: rRNA pseudouridine synthase [Chloroflexi bacterium]|nr:rRNA pseudouridine synthase [Chloroflexota bacterium]